MFDHIERDGPRRPHVAAPSPRTAPAVPADWPRGESQLGTYLKVILRRRWIALTAFLTVVVWATVYTFTAPPIYEAHTRLLIDVENPNFISFDEVVELHQTRGDYYLTQYNLLQSRALARRTVTALGLAEHPSLATSQPASIYRRLIAAVSAPQPRETSAESPAIEAVLAGLMVSPIKNSRIVDLRFRSGDPDLAMRIVNEQARGFIEQAMEFKFDVSKEAAEWLGERLAEQRKQVEAAESAVQRYREENGAVSFEDGQNIVVQKLEELNGALTRAKTERIQKEAAYRQLAAVRRERSAIDSVPAVLSNPVVQQQNATLAELQNQYAQLSEKLGERHPEIVRTKSAIRAAHAKLQAEVTKVVQGIYNEYRSALAQERSLGEAVEQQKHAALAMNRTAIEYGVLVREAESSRQLYQNLLQRAKETGVSSELRTSNIRIIDPAERPRTPISPRRRATVFFGLLGGALTGIVLALLFERLDDRIKTADEIRRRLGLAPLGLVPVVRDGAAGHAAPPLVNNGVPARFSEAFKTIRTNVLFSSPDEGPTSLVVTSTRASEGKSLVASNLAIALAQAGYRVLVIDADLRRPRLHDVLQAKREPGLSNLMVGDVESADAIAATEVPGLWLLPAGRKPPNPAELLGSRRFHDFLETSALHFDWIVLDSPPVSAVADASVLANAARGVLFVVGTDMTSRHAARLALDQLKAARARVVGAVLNRADLDRNAYYFSEYYHKEHARYYRDA